MYVASAFGNSIRKIFPNGTITTFAGTGSKGFFGDGGPATSAHFYHPYGVATDTIGNVYVSDTANSRVRKIFANGTITTFAGTGAKTFSGDGGPATSAALNLPQRVAVATSGEIYIADWLNQRVRKVLTNGTISTFATSIHATDVLLDTSGNIIVTDNNNNRVYKFSPNGTKTLFAGNGGAGAGGDGGPATSAAVQQPHGLGLDTFGSVFITQQDAYVRKVFTNGTIIRFAGDGQGGSTGDGGPATSAGDSALGIAFDTSGNAYLAEFGSNRIRIVYA